MQHIHNSHTCQGRILLAEDDLIGQVVTTRVLKQSGYEVEVVDTGLAVIESLKTSIYDLVIMDCSMPVMDGFTATRAIRNNGSGKRNAKIPIVALTAFSFASDRQRCVEAGMDDYLSKPVDSAMLLSIVRRCLGQEVSSKFPQMRTGQQKPLSLDHDFMDSLIDKFMAQIPQLITDLEFAIKQSDTEALHQLAHRLRGTADLFQATTVSRQARQLEYAEGAEDFTLTRKLARELINELQKLAATPS